MTQELLEAVPTGRASGAVGSTLNSVTLSAPTSAAPPGCSRPTSALTASDRHDNAVQVDGMSVNGIRATAPSNYFDQGVFEEIATRPARSVAELPSADVRVNMVPRTAATAPAGRSSTRGRGHVPSSNFTPELAALGLKPPNRASASSTSTRHSAGRSSAQALRSSRRRALGRGSDSHRLVHHRRRHPDLPARPVAADRGRQPDQSGMLHLTYQSQPAPVRHLLRRHRQFRGHQVTTDTFPTAEASGIRSPKRYWTGRVDSRDHHRQPALRGRLVGGRRRAGPTDPGRHATTNIGRSTRLTTDR